MSEKQRYQEILKSVRSDLKYLDILFSELEKKCEKAKLYHIEEELKNWIFDVFLDKLYEIDTRIIMIFKDFGLTNAELPLKPVRYYAEEIAFASWYYVERELLPKLYEAIGKYGKETEKAMSTVRNFMHKTNWAKMQNLKPENYVLPVKRARYVKARDELEKAKGAVKGKKWDEVLNHLRPSIDLALKEKFGFQKIFPMKQFLQDAEKHNFPLPSYALLYDYFDEGSHRIHEGKLHTPWECEKALNFVAEFIDRLDLVDISKEDIDKFKKVSSAVK
jgi:hypothetical protein